MPQPPAVELRRHFREHFTVEQHLKKLAGAIRDVESATADEGADYGKPE
jgi:hypothetical protein